MSKFDVYTEYKENNREIFGKTENSFKSFVKLKFEYVKNKTSELNQHKKFVKNRNKKYFIGDIQKIKLISGIYDDPSNLQKHINKLPKYSFAIWFKFRLEAPYFSKDDDEFYIIQNPILKETNFKVPMIRGSSWKGALASAFRELFKENYEDNKDKIDSFLRVFGVGSESIKAIESYIFDKSKDLKRVKEKLLEFILFELGLEVDRDLINEVKNISSKDKLLDVIKNKLSKRLGNNQRDLPLEFQTHKGRAIFYPTYFDKLSLEIINPHDRRKRAGTNPIHYEVVPAKTEGIFQLIYIPFDAVLKSDEKIREEAKEDLANIIKALSILSNKGIGAKTKLGWGRFEIRYLSCFRNFN
ncbi:CRISPR-associated protein [Persephonella atlantica]|uniref:CRISPR-associated protein n=1 Tax=Persephonella atlantica TaxID=2699429 RepID=A0ABS1GGD1_9AQUI|nr:RAMP superfamily CRISPR-associated protein [Persephonella atlantica]MBK3331984.1 CRISPR-associated protein [Persephonella atlantica]